jgi:hypothetical protein
MATALGPGLEFLTALMKKITRESVSNNICSSLPIRSIRFLNGAEISKTPFQNGELEPS